MSGGGSSGPSQTTVTNQNIPDWMQPYALGTKNIPGLLPQASALTNLANNPYQQYSGQQVAGLSPLQQQAMGNVQQMGVSSQTGQATGMAGMAGMNAGNIASTYQPGQIGYNQTGINDYTGQNVQNYMSPYMQNVVNQQKAGAISDYANQLPGMGAVAAGSGNLGGSRQALMQSQAQRGLMGTLGNIQATGSQNAFQNAQQQFNAQNQLGLQSQTANQQAGLQAQGQNLQSQQFGANLGLQGLQLQNQAAGTLGQLGQDQYGQQAGINTALNSLGSEQQATQQQGLNTQYQNFLNQQNYPYAQLSYMSDILHGTATGAAGSGGVYNYSQPPNAAGQIAGLGAGAAGLAGLFGSGG
jgi:hypothetical protein